MKKIIDEIEADLFDIKTKKFRYNTTEDVPSRHDTTLTFEKGIDKVGKEIETCVLYVDIRGSVELNRKHHTITMGRIYTAFSKSMLKIARHHNGYVRNIIGDRVMIVFPKNNCYTNAVNCAISIYHISHNLINNVFEEVDFKVGIGIDHGTLKVVKVGLSRRDREGFDNKNLVWIGYPANIASRLTDVANKELDNSKVKVNYYPHDFSNLFPNLGGMFGNAPLALPKKTTNIPREEIISNEEFVKKLIFNKEDGLSYSSGTLINFTKIESKIDFPAILMTSRVFNGFKAANPDRNSIIKNLWKAFKNHNIKNVDCDVYGGTINWVI
jgi:adenylate cyclase